MKNKVRHIDSVLTAILDNTSIQEPTDWINPTNDRKQDDEPEKTKFFGKGAYNPQYTYDRCEPDNDKVRKALADLGFSGMSPRQVLEQIAMHEPKGIERILEDKRIDILNKMDLAKKVGTDTTATSITIFTAPNGELLEQAYRTLRDIQPAKEGELVLDHTEMLENIKKALAREGLDRYQVPDGSWYGWKAALKKDMSADLAISQVDRTVYIKEGARFRPEQHKKSAVHEGTHAKRSVNGELSGLGILRYGTKGALITEEGLATVMEERAGVLSPNSLREYAIRVIAVNEALTKSFSEVYESLRKLDLSKDKAYYLTKRAKRGLTDTAQPGGFIKDHIYLLGRKKVKDWLAKGGNFDDLFIGKVSIEDVGIVKAYFNQSTS